MKKPLIVLFFGLFFCVAESFAVAAPQTDTYQNPNAQFLRAKELFAESRYKAARAGFEQYLKTIETQSLSAVETQSLSVAEAWSLSAAEARLLSAVEVQYQQAAFFYAAATALVAAENALPLLQNYVQKYPVNAYGNELSFLFGLAYFNQNDFRNALWYFEQTDAGKLGAQFQNDFLFMKGISLFNTGKNYENPQEGRKRIETARDIFSQLNATSPPSGERGRASYYQAYSDYLLGNYNEALPVFLSLENSAEFGNSVQYFIPQILVQQGNYREAINRAENVINANLSDARNVEMRRVLGKACFYENNFLKSLENYNIFEKSAATVSREDFYLMGVANFKLENFREAVAHLSRVTAVDDALAQNAFLFLAQSYLALNEPGNARMAFEAAARTGHDPQAQEEAMFNYAISTYNTAFSPFNESVNAFRAFLDKFPESKNATKAYEYLANVYLTATDYEAAYHSINTLKTQNPNILRAKQRLLFNMGVDAFNVPNLTKAIDRFTGALSVNGDANTAMQAYFWRGEAYAQTGSNILARADFNRVLAAANNAEFMPVVHYNLGYTYFAEQNWTAARTYFQLFIDKEINTGSAKFIDALNRLGDCYFQLRDFDNATKFYAVSAGKEQQNSDYALFQMAFIEGLRRNHNNKITLLDNLINIFPRSDFMDDALFEKARACIDLNDSRQAIAVLDVLTTTQPNSFLAPKAIIQKALLYYNLKETERAISLYKQVIMDYPNSEEAQVAFESLEKLYLEANRVDEFIAFSGQTQFSIDKTKEDRLLFSAAERQYIAGKFNDAIAGFEKYLKQYPNGNQQVKANFYVADSYRQMGKTAQARDLFGQIALQKGNPFAESAAEKVANMYFDERNFSEAKRYFEILRDAAQNKATIQTAQLGILRSEVRMLNDEAALKLATELLSQDISDTDILRELRYYKATSLLNLDRAPEAVSLLRELIQEPRTAQGSEAYFLLADYTFTEEKNPEKAQQLINEFIAHGSPYQYWIARSFILLADMAMERGDDFQAKQYLLSLQSNYKGDERDIQEEIAVRLAEIGEREK